LIQESDTRALTLRAVEDSNPVDADQLLTYTLHYANQSGSTINDARLALTSLEGAMVESGGTDSGMLGSRGAGESGTRQTTVLVTAAAGDQVRAEAVVYNDDDPTVEARSTVQTPVVDGSTVEATLTVDANTAQRGEQVRVSLQVTNPSATTPQNQVRVEAQLPTGITAIASARASIDAACTYSTWTRCWGGETVYWTIDTLAPLETTAMDLWYDPIVAGSPADGDILFFEAQTTVGGVPRAVAGATVAVDGP
ncbi:MAG: DUF11 domain-containing protein, partial [Deltaproteobacteria bacterium]|nr:DUF11 domain-containing protein [Deltaproteobacteria bacterium]